MLSGDDPVMILFLTPLSLHTIISYPRINPEQLRKNF